MLTRATRGDRRLLRPVGRIAATVLWRVVGWTYDQRTGVRTEDAIQPREVIVVGNNAPHAVEYSPSSTRSFWLSVGSLDIDPARFTFVDIGSGMGRVLLLAAKLPYKRIEGVEFAPHLNAIAARNIEAVFPSTEHRSRFRLQTLDAADYEIPPGPCVLYLFNPFGPTVVARVAQNILASYRAFPREIFVIYVNPRHKEMLDPRDFKQVDGPWYAKYIDRCAHSRFTIYRLH